MIVWKVHQGAIAHLCVSLTLLVGCSGNKEEVSTDHPRLTANVILRDVSFHSAALSRDMPYRVIMPAAIPPRAMLPVVYVLHGGAGSFRDWSNYSDVARFAENAMLLVMPEGDESCCTNSVEKPQDRYEDYIAHDLVSDVESRFPAAKNRANRAIVGLSMGGFGAIKIGLRHPELFAFAGGLSSAVDVPNRPFSITRIGQWRHYQSIFGPWGSATRRDNDPFVLVRSADPKTSPYFFLTCGDQEGLLPANRRFAKLLEERHLHYEFHVVPGGHNWNQWNARLEDCFKSLLQHLSQSR